jgi:endoribonuclease Dicer
MVRAAMESNIVAFLETGAGKTLIAVELMKQTAEKKWVAKGQKSLMIFLAPTVHLVKQVSSHMDQCLTLF